VHAHTYTHMNTENLFSPHHFMHYSPT